MFDRLGKSLAGNAALVESLNLAVPLWIDKLGSCTDAERIARASRCATIVGSQGDALQFKGTSAAARRSTAQAFNALAEGLACAAYMPGGITFAGRHWCTGHAACDAALTVAGVQDDPPEPSGGPTREETTR